MIPEPEQPPSVQEVEQRLHNEGFARSPDPGPDRLRVHVEDRNGVPIVRVEGEHARSLCFAFLEVRSRAQLEVLTDWLRARCRS